MYIGSTYLKKRQARNARPQEKKQKKRILQFEKNIQRLRKGIQQLKKVLNNLGHVRAVIIGDFFREFSLISTVFFFANSVYVAHFPIFFLRTCEK